MPLCCCIPENINGLFAALNNEALKNQIEDSKCTWNHLLSCTVTETYLSSGML